MRTRIVRRFLWSVFILFAISLFGVDLYVTHLTSSNEIADLRATLTTQARMLAAGFPAASPHFDTWATTAAAQTGARVTGSRFGRRRAGGFRSRQRVYGW